MEVGSTAAFRVDKQYVNERVMIAAGLYNHLLTFLFEYIYHIVCKFHPRSLPNINIT